MTDAGFRYPSVADFARLGRRRQTPCHADSPPQHEALIERIITAGHYSDVDQVITEALRQMAARERQLDNLRAKIQIGLDQLDREEGVEWTPELMERLSREADEMHRRGELPSLNVCP